MRPDLLRLALLTFTLAFGGAVFAQTCDTGPSRPFDQAPVSSNPISVAPFSTTTIESEHFNCGGEGQGYHDNTPGNQSTSTYRNPASVDVMEITTGGRTVQFFDTGEWMAYTINLGSAGTFNLGIFAASNQVPAGQVAGQYKLQLDGVDITGSVSVLSTGSWDSYAWTDAPGSLSLPAGVHTLTLVSVQQSFRVDKLRLVATTPPPSCDSGTSRPFSGTPVNGVPIPIAGTGTTMFEAEHYNCGGEGQGYHDNTPGNQSTSPYRNPDSVDINDQTNGLRTVQFFDTGEWMVYTINVAASGSYTFGISAASGVSGGGGGLYRIEIDGVDVTGSVPVPTTPDWENPQWVDAPNPVSLTAGTHTLRLVSVRQSYRVDRLRITAGGTGCSTSGLTLCIQFEAAPDTTFAGSQVTTRSLGGSIVWEAQNAAPDSATDVNRIALVSGGRDGSMGIKLQTLNDDSNVHSSGSLERSEIQMTQPDTGAVNGADTWWANSLFVPTDSTLLNTIDWSIGVMQFHGTPSAGDAPNFLLSILYQTGNSPHLVFRAFTAGAGGIPGRNGTQYTYDIDGHTDRIGQCIFDDVQKGVWYDFVHHIKWSYTGTGSHEIWMRKAGGPVVKVLDKSGINTLYTGDTAYTKLGAYHDPVVGANTSVIHDRLRRGNSADAVRMPDFNLAGAPFQLCAGVTLGNP